MRERPDGRDLLLRPAPPGYLEEWAGVLATPPPVQDEKQAPLMVFRLGDEQLALPNRLLEEVIPMRPIRTIPHRSGEVIRGLVNIRGRLELCVSLGHFLGVLQAVDAQAEMHRLMVLRARERRYVFPVSRVVGLRSLRQEELRLGSEGLGSPDMLAYVKGTFVHEDMVTGLLDPQPVFDALNRSLLR